jgi:A/G-specific adenine glycosylase
LYAKFLVKYPDPGTLSQAQLEELENLIRPLGMEHKRATLLKTVASEIVQKNSGRIPASLEELLKLPGVGLYAANAVLCFAYGKDVPLVDTNAIRIFKRVFCFKSQRRRPKDDPRLWEFARDIIPHGKAKDFNLAVIDLVHEICTPKKPRCVACPLKAFCKYAGGPEKLKIRDLRAGMEGVTVTVPTIAGRSQNATSNRRIPVRIERAARMW